MSCNGNMKKIPDTHKTVDRPFLSMVRYNKQTLYCCTVANQQRIKAVMRQENQRCGAEVQIRSVNKSRDVCGSRRIL